MILATGAVHTHLVRTSLRTYVSINVQSAECLDVHYVAVLIGVGATTVNPYLAQEAIADRYGKGLFGSLGYAEALQRYRRAVDDGLLKVMSKMGISVISSFRGGYNFEAVGLSRTLVGQFFPAFRAASPVSVLMASSANPWRFMNARTAKVLTFSRSADSIATERVAERIFGMAS